MKTSVFKVFLLSLFRCFKRFGRPEFRVAAALAGVRVPQALRRSSSHGTRACPPAVRCRRSRSPLFFARRPVLWQYKQNVQKDGIRNGFGFFRFFGRYLIMLCCMELYDILFFDWFLLCHSNFFPHFYPELKGIVGPHTFGYNKRTHILHFLLYIPLCAVIAGICMIF
ncbi:MAG: hypothetical protein ACLTZV_10055 [Oscillospiraceae bacterium]